MKITYPAHFITTEVKATLTLDWLGGSSDWRKAGIWHARQEYIV